MSKIKITIEHDAKIETLEADMAVLMLENGGNLSFVRKNAGDAAALGLLGLAVWHIKQAWLKANSN